MFIKDDKKVLVVPSATTRVEDVLTILSKRLKRPNLVQDILEHFDTPNTIQKKLTENTRIGADDSADVFLQELLDEVHFADVDASLRVENCKIGYIDAVAVKLIKPSPLMQHLKDRVSDFSAAQHLLRGLMEVSETEFIDILYLTAAQDMQKGKYNTMMLLGSLHESGVLDALSAKAGLLDIVPDNLGEVVSDTDQLSKPLSDIQYLTAVKDILTSVAYIKNDAYTAMSKLDALREDGLIDETLGDTFQLLSVNTTPLLERLRVYGYNADKLGAIEFKADLYGSLPDTEDQDVLFYAKSPEDAIRILAENFKIKDQDFIITAENTVYIIPNADTVVDTYYYRDYILHGKVSDYMTPSPARHKPTV